MFALLVVRLFAYVHQCQYLAIINILSYKCVLYIAHSITRPIARTGLS